MSERIYQLIRQSYQYFYIDGLPELASGGMYLLVGAWLVVMSFVQPGTLVAALVGLALPVLILGGVYLTNRLLRAFKEHLTHPRTGYVSYRRDRRDSRRWIVIAVAFSLPFILMLLPEEWADLPLVIGAILGAVHIYLGYRLGIWRFYLEGALAGLLGIACAIFVSDETLGMGLIFLGTGTVMLISGALTLWRYLQSHPLPNEAGG